jgi:hypothetical protein
LEAESQGRSLAKETYKRQNFKLWQTEFALPATEESNGIAGGLSLATHMLNDLKQAETQAWLYWALLPPSGGAERLGLMDQAGPPSGHRSDSGALPSSASFCLAIRKDPPNGGSTPLLPSKPQYNGITVIFLNSFSQPAQETVEMRGWNLEPHCLSNLGEEIAPCAPCQPAGSKMNLNLEPQSITTLVAQIHRVR